MTAPACERLLFPVEEAAARLGCGRTTVYKLVTDGELCLVHIGRRALIDGRSIDSYVERLREASDA